MAPPNGHTSAPTVSCHLPAPCFQRSGYPRSRPPAQLIPHLNIILVSPISCVRACKPPLKTVRLAPHHTIITHPKNASTHMCVPPVYVCVCVIALAVNFILLSVQPHHYTSHNRVITQPNERKNEITIELKQKSKLINAIRNVISPP